MFSHIAVQTQWMLSQSTDYPALLKTSRQKMTRPPKNAIFPTIATQNTIASENLLTKTNTPPTDCYISN